MKRRILILLVVGATGIACNNDGKGNSFEDSSAIKGNTNNMDNNNAGEGDTASYDRVTQKTTDTSHQ